MQNITFKFNNKEFDASVEDNFLDLPIEVQQKRLYSSLESKYGLKETPSKENKNILDYISLIERPIQAAKVGLKETNIGSLVNEALGGVDLTPAEGFMTGVKRGWMGTDEVRTQDYLPEDMNPALKMALGFSGDVLTDPLTFFGPAIASKGASAIATASAKTGLTPVLQKAGQKALDANIPLTDRKGSDVLRAMNIATGEGKKVKGLGTQASYNDLQARMSQAMNVDIEDLSNFFAMRAKELGVGQENVQLAFRKAMERQAKTENVLDEFDQPIPLLDKEGTPLMRGGEPVYQKRKVGYHDVDKDTARILGDRGLEEVDKWTELFDDAVAYGQAFGQPIREITSKGYFPRVITKEWRDTLDEIDIKELEELGDAPIFGQTFRGERGAEARELTFDEAEDYYRDFYTKKYMDTPGGSPNPADIPFFEKDPIVAMGTRLSAQAKAAQRKWFLDEITDSGYGIGTMFTRGMLDDIKSAFYKERPGSKAFEETLDGKWQATDEFQEYVQANTHWKPERKIGKWLTESEVDGDKVWTERLLNPEWRGALDKTNPQFIESAPLTNAQLNKLFRDEDYRRVNAVPDGFIDDELIDNAFQWNMFKGLSEQNLTPMIFDKVMQSGSKKLEDILEIAADVIHPVRNSLKQLEEALGKERYQEMLKEYGYVLTKDQENAITLVTKEALEAANEVAKGPKPKFYAPASIQRQIEDTAQVMSGPSHRDKEFINWYDKITNTWKSWSLGVRPAYHTRNAIGNMWNMYMIAGVSPNLNKMVNDAGKLQYYARFGGSEARRQEVMDNIVGAKGKLLQGSKAYYKKINNKDWTADDFAGTGYSMKDIYQGAQARGVTAGHYTADTVREMQLAMEVKTGRGSFFERFIGPENPMVRTGFAIGGTIEGNARFTIFLHTLRDIQKNPGKYEWVAPDGKKFKLNEKLPEDYFKTKTSIYADRGSNTHVPMNKDDMIMDVAARKVKEALFDYGDLSSFEQNILKRTMPFYTWSRKNLPAQFKALLQNPQRAEQLALAKQQFEHDTGELSTSDYGKFWGDRVPVFLGSEKDGIVRAFTMLNLLPMADLQYALDPKRVIAELATPLVKAPLEALANYDTFMGRAIKSYPGEMQDFMGIKLPPRLHHFAKLLVPLAELNRLNPANVFGVNELDPKTGISVNKSDAFLGLGASRDYYKDYPQVARWVRFFSGVPQYNVNLDRIEYFDNKNLMRDVAELKGRIKWAARKGENRKLADFYALLEAIEQGKTNDPFQRRS